MKLPQQETFLKLDLHSIQASIKVVWSHWLGLTDCVVLLKNPQADHQALSKVSCVLTAFTKNAAKINIDICNNYWGDLCASLA